MSFPRYERYKDSGVEWLGEVPEQWETHAIKRFASFIYGDALTADSRNEEGEVPVFGSNGPVGQHDQPNTHGPVILVGRKGSNGALNWSSCPVFAIDTVYFIDVRYCKGDLRWLFWALHVANLGSASQDTGVPGLSREIAYNTCLPVPTVTEQLAIAVFLDRETATIDALIAEQRRLIDLLKEKRQAVLSHAVTKGLNPDAPMKDSGVEWLGVVPEHWKIAALNYRFEIALGKMLDEKRITGKHLAPYLRNVDVQWGQINTNDLPEMDFSGDDLERYSLKKGDLLVCEGGDVGRAAVWNGDVEECYYQKALHRLRPRCPANDSPQFMFYQLQASAKNGRFTESGGKATIAHLTAESLRRYLFPFPSVGEQHAIVAFLDQETARIDTLVTEAETAIALLQERRIALISAAVTGKIDVRGLVAREAVSICGTSVK